MKPNIPTLLRSPAAQKIWSKPRSYLTQYTAKLPDEDKQNIGSALLLIGSVIIASATLFFHNKAFAQTNQAAASAVALEQLGESEKPDIEKDRKRRLDAIDEEVSYLESMLDLPFATISVDGLIREGDSHSALPAIAKRLALFGDADSSYCQQAETADASSADTSASCVHDEISVQNLKSFQRRHGLAQDGVIGPKTLDMLNLSPEDRIVRLLLSRERMADFDGFNDDEYIFVNIPEYRLYYVVDDQPVFRSKVIVGKPSWATPVFSDELERFVVNPEWRIPTSITTKEIAGKVADDPDYLADRNMEIRKDSYLDTETIDPNTINWDEITPYDFDYFIVQKAGPKNPLGQVKYLFPNENAVYIHDTQATSLFNKNRRAFSHGCIRIEKPFELALSLANRHDRKTAERIFDETLKRGETHTVNLKNPIPVHMVYWTAWVTPKGERHFRNDIYSRDGNDLKRVRTAFRQSLDERTEQIAGR